MTTLAVEGSGGGDIGTLTQVVGGMILRTTVVVRRRRCQALSLPEGLGILEGTSLKVARGSNNPRDGNLLRGSSSTLEGIIHRGLGRNLPTTRESTGGDLPVMVPGGGGKGIVETDTGVLGDGRGAVGELLDGLEGGLAVDGSDDTVDQVLGDVLLGGVGVKDSDGLDAIGHGRVERDGLGECRNVVAVICSDTRGVRWGVKVMKGRYKGASMGGRGNGKRK